MKYIHRDKNNYMQMYYKNQKMYSKFMKNAPRYTKNILCAKHHVYPVSTYLHSVSCPLYNNMLK